MPIKEDKGDANETRAGARQSPPDSDRAGEAEWPATTGARVPSDAGRPEKFSTRAFTARWSIVAGACLIVAATFLLMRRIDAAFVAATLGIVAWFWNERNRLRPHGIEADDRFRDEGEEAEDRDEK